MQNQVPYESNVQIEIVVDLISLGYELKKNASRVKVKVIFDVSVQQYIICIMYYVIGGWGDGLILTLGLMNAEVK